MNGSDVARVGLLTLALALSAAVAGDAPELLPTTDTVVTAASSIESAGLTSDDGGVIAGHLATISGTPAQYIAGGGCERVRRPNCNRRTEGRTHR